MLVPQRQTGTFQTLAQSTMMTVRIDLLVPAAGLPAGAARREAATAAFQPDASLFRSRGAQREDAAAEKERMSSATKQMSAEAGA